MREPICGPGRCLGRGSLGGRAFPQVSGSRAAGREAAWKQRRRGRPCQRLASVTLNSRLASPFSQSCSRNRSFLTCNCASDVDIGMETPKSYLEPRPL